MDNWELHHGDALEVLKILPSAHVDAMVTDPPAGISFMGKDWDGDKGGRDGWVAWLSSVMTEARRVMKPGAVGLVWALPRTSHWTATALEDAGLAIEDRVSHIFGTGFPKHKSKLKPAVEDWWMVRKPGGRKWLGVDACRVGTADDHPGIHRSFSSGVGDGWNRPWQDNRPPVDKGTPDGRWPPHLCLSHSPECNGECADNCPIRIMGEQSGKSVSTDQPRVTSARINIAKGDEPDRVSFGHSDTGTAARFFPQFQYFAKASRRDREEGLDDMPLQTGNTSSMTTRGERERGETRDAAQFRNHHPTVKASPLMRWLCRLACPLGGTILDPFMGSGSTGKAAMSEGFKFVGIEQDESFVNIAEARIYAAEAV